MRALWSAAAGMAGAAGVAGEADGSARVTAHARAANIRRHSSSVTHLWPRWGSRRCGAVIVGNDRCGGLLQGVVAVETAAAGMAASGAKWSQRGWLLRGMAAAEMAAAGRTKKEAACATSFH